MDGVGKRGKGGKVGKVGKVGTGRKKVEMEEGKR
jgi:hypothetical protein